MPQPFMDAPLPGCVSIDATKPDGYLDNARAGNPLAGAHANVQQAAANLLECAKVQRTASTASLIGHGTMGLFSVGAGGSKGTSQQYISLDNQAVWTPVLQSLKDQITALVLYGAQIGGGSLGAQLLYALAKTVNAPVYAPTGVVYCRADGTFTLQMDAVWQMATPAAAPEPIMPPTASLGASGPGPRISACAAFGLGGVPLPTKSAMALAGQVHWNQPFEAPGEPAALVTGRLRASFGGTAFRSFTILGNTLVRDDAQPTRLYPVGPGFRAILLGR